nr:MADS-box protein FLOWERING LOCUS C-like [Ipomoea batatas]
MSKWFDLNVAAASPNQVLVSTNLVRGCANRTRGFNLNVAPDDDEEMIRSIFDTSNLEHVMAAYSWFDDCCTKLKAKKEKHLMSANRVANEQMVSVPSFANVGAAQFDLNVTATNLVRGFNLNVAPSAYDFCCISCSTFQSECDTGC